MLVTEGLSTEDVVCKAIRVGGDARFFYKELFIRNLYCDRQNVKKLLALPQSTRI